jgi:hypothetical protein
LDLRFEYGQARGWQLRDTAQVGTDAYHDGRFHFITTLADAPKYASGVRERPTPDEAMATASSALAYAGTYTVDEGTRTIHANIETSTFPNFVGAPNQRRIVTSITADEMKFTNPRTASGLTLEMVWKRAK